MRTRRSAVLVIAFVVLDLVVIALAYVATHREDTPAAAATSVSVDDGVDRTPPIEGPLVLAASPSGALARVTRGSCDERDLTAARVWLAPSFKAPLVEVSVPGLQEALGIRVTDDTVTLVGAERNCSLASFTSTDGGATWKQGKPDPTVWYVGTDTTSAAINGPAAGGALNLDCTPTSVVTQASDGAGLVTCAGFNAMEVRPGSDTVAATVTVATPAGIARTGSGALLALGSQDACPSVIVAAEAGADPRQVACFADRDGAPLGLATSGDRVFAQIGYALLVSGNGGRSFTTYPGQAYGGATASPSPG